MAKGYSAQGADEIAFLDITATKQAARNFVRSCFKGCGAGFCALTVGGVFGLSRTYQLCCLLGLIK